MFEKRYILVFLALLFASFLFAKPFTVVIDPGHGGKDPGAVGDYGQEKTINLKVALNLGKLISDNFPDVKVIYTRTTDVYVKLQERPNIANDADGDLFISIHTNASESSKAYGSETYTLGLSKSQANFNVAKRENSVLLLEEDKEVYQGFDPTSPDSYIMFEFMQSKYIDQSVEIAYYIQKEFASVKRLDRGVRQAIFWVLHQVKMPSILIELGFVTNPSEEKFLTSTEGQKKMATCIFHAFEKYKHEYDKRTITTPHIEKQGSKEKPVKAKDSVKKDTQKQKTDIKPNKSDKVDNTHKIKEESKENIKESQNIVTKKEKVIKDSTPSIANNPDIVYKIQVFSSRKLVADDSYDLQKVSNFKPTSYIHENGWYKYMCANASSYSAAVENLKRVQKVYKDAMVVAFNKGSKISVSEARKLEKIVPDNKIVFKIQVFSSRQIVPNNHYDIVRLKKYGNVSYYIENGWYKYTCSETESFEAAKENLNNIQNLFKDAVIIAFENDKKISLKEALNK